MRHSGGARASAWVLLAALWASPCVALSSGRIERVVDPVIRRLMAQDRIPGVAVGIAVGGRSRVLDYGEASLRTHRPVTPHTLFEIGSISKTFAATLAAYAVLRGSLSLADSPGRYLPSLRATRLGKEVTLLNLATHTAGGLPLQVPDGVRTNAELMRYLRAWRPKYPPGSHRTYSNVGIGLLGLATARSMRRGYSLQLQEFLFPRLRMRHTFLRVPPAEMPDYAEGYDRDGRPVRMAPGVLSAQAYGVKSTAGDLLRYLEANMGLIRVNGMLWRALRATHTGYFVAGALTQDLAWEQYPYPVTLKTLLAGNSLRMLLETVPAARLDPPEPPRGMCGSTRPEGPTDSGHTSHSFRRRGSAS
jgi:beta-lactamase class C